MPGLGCPSLGIPFVLARVLTEPLEAASLGVSAGWKAPWLAGDQPTCSPGPPAFSAIPDCTTTLLPNPGSPRAWWLKHGGSDRGNPPHFPYLDSVPHSESTQCNQSRKATQAQPSRDPKELGKSSGDFRVRHTWPTTSFPTID